MKILIVALLLPCIASAQDKPVGEPLGVGGVTTLVADKIKEAKGATVFTLGAGPAAALYLPIWTFHDKADVDLVELGLGGMWRMNEHPEPLAVFGLNLPGISGRIWGFQWAKEHLRRSPFPPIFFGPTLVVPIEYKNVSAMRWDGWRDYLGLSISVRLSK